MIDIRVVSDLADIQAARGIRYEVFVIEQQVPLVLEVDARDALPDTIQVLMTIEGKPAGTGRLLPDHDHPGVVHVGRLAVLERYRGQQLGARLLAELEAEAIRQLTPDPSASLISELSAQEYALDFYRKAGYETLGRERYLDAGIWHHDMRKTLIAPVQ